MMQNRPDNQLASCRTITDGSPLCKKRRRCCVTAVRLEGVRGGGGGGLVTVTVTGQGHLWLCHVLRLSDEQVHAPANPVDSAAVAASICLPLAACNK
ncbi:hypothetical protein LSTR_LSTR008831 [Laodelphax striatellus]|uniref:Uncharacterized protein n=1 Tax=Laodelphax striatellus TaxID=195883 RepID=A0A482WTK7_LAOST|nr:hypothetical protein LSTR_LSTR008831 [Laodelphax striatellus]